MTIIIQPQISAIHLREIKAPTKIKIQKRNKNLLNLTEKLLVPLCEHELAQITPEKWLPTTGKKEE